MSNEASHIVEAGTMFGNFRINRTLGAGAFGAVYEAYEQPLNKRVALKVLHAQMASNANISERFLREAKLATQIEHPHIVNGLSHGMFNNLPYFAMQFLEGESLAQRIQRGPLGTEGALEVLVPILAAVATIHNYGIVHRDLKPDNIFLAKQVTGGIVPKLLDFGIAKVEEAEHSLTRTSALMGTPCYMSPEQAKESKHIDARSDQWAMATIVHEAVTGSRLFKGDSLLDILSGIAIQPIAMMQSVNPQISTEFDGALFKALSRDPSQRYPSVREFSLALLPYASTAVYDQWIALFSNTEVAPVAALQLHSHAAMPSVNSSGVQQGGMAMNNPSMSGMSPGQSMSGMSSGQSMPGMASGSSGQPATVAFSGQLPVPMGIPPVANTLPGTSRPTNPGVIIAAVLGVLVLVGGAVGFALKLTQSDPTPTHVTTARPPPTPTVRVAVSTVPATATIELDGHAAGTGVLLRSIQFDGQPHTLRVSAAGYETRTIVFRNEAPPEVVTLVASAPAGAPPVAVVPTPPVNTVPANNDRIRRDRDHRHQDPPPTGTRPPRIIVE